MEQVQIKFDLSIALSLYSWSALTLAVQNSWGGPESKEKRDWFAGAISDLLASNPDADVEYVEEFLLQVMNDEFDVNVDDGSGEEIAAKIVGFRKLTLRGEFQKIDEMYAKWIQKQSKGAGRVSDSQYVAKADEENDTDWDSDDTDEDEEEDVPMHEAPPVVRAAKEKVQPRVDEDGFTEVMSKRKR